jgi:hypothetical protein
MSEHKFVVGERVLFLPDWFIDPATEGHPISHQERTGRA